MSLFSLNKITSLLKDNGCIDVNASLFHISDEDLIFHTNPRHTPHYYVNINIINLDYFLDVFSDDGDYYREIGNLRKKRDLKKLVKFINENFQM